MVSITHHLLHNAETAQLYRNATQSNYLRLAGQGKLPKDDLSKWLSQDRLYAQAYTRFIGGLISRLHLPMSSQRGTVDTLEWRVLAMLQGALEGIMTELQFFEKTAREYDLDLQACSACSSSQGATDFRPDDVTKRYIDLFDSFGGEAKKNAGAQHKSLIQGLVLLWATEKVYLDAWTYAKEQGGADAIANGDDDLDGGALRRHFIPNWTSDEFKRFVKEIQECVDACAAAYSAEDEVEKIAMEVWRDVLVLEESFWPSVKSRKE
ncbi:uncharacterized protein BCR38DRAFT_340062 [Pseudomassariella vexata]|uniref:Thiaminase-2/PQQC domain-containing protein n=1 Tax=Pseudomassariella vexata TaxID=1141098 RepID=A0A1Y2E4M4_9PEZI|nr:uncharacterized protein BCR38DRAFT_340062 [Pseudomassariella vexata]ORY66469.1 hypothetical protein BCR38DRAFT_340062 [Pseudomassariella vexata]